MRLRHPKPFSVIVRPLLAFLAAHAVDDVTGTHEGVGDDRGGEAEGDGGAGEGEEKRVGEGVPVHSEPAE